LFKGAELKTLSFAGFKIKLLTCPLLPPTTIYTFSSHRHAKEFVEILKTLDLLIKANKIIVRKPKGRIIRPS
jgi:hypothetical protein